MAELPVHRLDGWVVSAQELHDRAPVLTIRTDKVDALQNFAQNWKRVPDRVPMNSFRNCRSSQAIVQATAMKPTVRISLWAFSVVAPISVTPNNFRPATLCAEVVELGALPARAASGEAWITAA